MFIVGAYIISKYSNMSYEEFVTERIFKPLGMTDSMFSPAQAAKTGRFTENWTKFGRRIPTWFDEETAAFGAGAAGVITTAADLVRRALHTQGDTDMQLFP
jgi:CubicO group peptidase (beta-lactamase class C family)